MKKFELKEIILIGVFAALMVVGARLSIPTPFGVAITFQLFFAIYAGLLLSPRSALFSQLIYILIGLSGLPVFASGGGFDYVQRPSFGYIIGFALTAFVIAILMKSMKELKLYKVILISTIGFIVSYFVGNIYFYVIMNVHLGEAMSMMTIMGIMIPFMIKDYILLIIASYSATIVIPILRRAGYTKVRTA